MANLFILLTIQIVGTGFVLVFYAAIYFLIHTMAKQNNIAKFFGA